MRRFVNTIRQRVVLTREEKCAVAFIVIAIVLGVGTKHYRELHPRAAVVAPALFNSKPKPHAPPQALASPPAPDDDRED